MLLVETGEALRRTRESSGLSLEEVSEDLNIPVITLEQIEAGSFGSFNDIYELKKMILDYAKYLGLNTEVIINRFNEYMFDTTSKISLEEIEKIIKEKKKEEVDEDRICSPYTMNVSRERPLPYVIAGIVIIILVIIVVLWSLQTVASNSLTTKTTMFINNLGGELIYEFTK